MASRERTSSLAHGRSFAAGILAAAIALSLIACAHAPVAPRPESFSSADRLVGVYYFYWYKWPTEHFFHSLEKGGDALTDHFPNPKKVDYESVAWHKRELADIAWCGIDFILPVYWGAPGNYDLPPGIFSVRGLDAMQKAREQLVSRGKTCPRIGMFYDTTTLLNSIRRERPLGGKADLTTTRGKELFYGTIRDFWRRLDRKHWAMINGRPIIVLYGAGFAANYDQATFDYLYESFERDFGVRPYVIAEASWRGVKVEARYRWGAALAGPRIDDVVQIGPGYDDRAVPGRSTPIRDRESGRFYEYSWIEAIASGRRIVLIETWNEMHEGTDICRSAEYGRKYMRLTRKYVRLFKCGEAVEKSIELEHRAPIPRDPNMNEGREFADAREVFIDFAKRERKGLRIVRQPDGIFEITHTDGRRCVRSSPSKTGYLYFAVPDPFFYNMREPLAIEIEYLDRGSGAIALEYDSHNKKAHLGGAYTRAGAIGRQGTGRWLTHVFRLDDAAFLNRQNGASDFRFAIAGDPLCVSRVSVAKLGKNDKSAAKATRRTKRSEKAKRDQRR